MLLIFLGCLAGWLVVPVVWAQPRAWAGDAPTTARGADRIGALIAELGNADFRTRRDASNQLRQIGAAALPRLKDASSAASPEIRARAGVLVRELEHHPVPGRPRIHRHTSSANYAVLNGVQVINIDDEGRGIRILRGPNGIQMTVSGQVNGRPATETYRAATAEELRTLEPEAFALYDRFVRRLGLDGERPAFGQLPGAVNPMLLRGNGMILPPRQFQPFIATGGDDLRLLRARLDAQMDKAALKPAQRRRVIDAIQHIDEVRQTAAAPGNNQDRQIERYDQACDGLRKVASQLKLPDPGDALPPPQSARLGVSVIPDDGTGEGIVVAHVLVHSRADRMGIQEDDILRKVNGKPVRAVTELRELVTRHAKGLIVDITRDGRQMQLREKTGK